MTTPCGVSRRLPRRHPFSAMLLQRFRARLVAPAKTKAPAARDGGSSIEPRSVCQRVRTDLNVYGARARALAAFHQPGRAVAAGAPEPAAFPAGIRIVDAPVEALRIEAHRVRDAHQDHLAVFQRHKTVIEIGGGDRDVLAETERVVLVDPGVITGFDALVLEAFEARAGIFVELPSLRAVITGRGWAIQRALAQPPVKTDKMATRLRAPGNTVGVDVAPANSDSGFRNSVKLGQVRLRIKAHEARLSAEYTDRVPDRAVLRVGHDGIRPGAACDASVLGSVAGLARLGVIVELAITVGVEHERRPTDSLLLVVRFIPYLCVDPASHRAASGQP